MKKRKKNKVLSVKVKRKRGVVTVTKIVKAAKRRKKTGRSLLDKIIG